MIRIRRTENGTSNKRRSEASQLPRYYSYPLFFEEGRGDTEALDPLPLSLYPATPAGWAVLLHKGFFHLESLGHGERSEGASQEKTCQILSLPRDDLVSFAEDTLAIPYLYVSRRTWDRKTAQLLWTDGNGSPSFCQLPYLVVPGVFSVES